MPTQVTPIRHGGFTGSKVHCSCSPGNLRTRRTYVSPLETQAVLQEWATRRVVVVTDLCSKMYNISETSSYFPLSMPLFKASRNHTILGQRTSDPKLPKGVPPEVWMHILSFAEPKTVKILSEVRIHASNCLDSP